MTERQNYKCCHLHLGIDSSAANDITASGNESLNSKESSSRAAAVLEDLLY